MTAKPPSPEKLELLDINWHGRPGSAAPYQNQIDVWWDEEIKPLWDACQEHSRQVDEALAELIKTLEMIADENWRSDPSKYSPADFRHTARTRAAKALAKYRSLRGE